MPRVDENKEYLTNKCAASEFTNIHGTAKCDSPCSAGQRDDEGKLGYVRGEKGGKWYIRPLSSADKIGSDEEEEVETK